VKPWVKTPYTRKTTNQPNKQTKQRLRQNCEFEANLGFIVRSCLKNKQKRTEMVISIHYNTIWWVEKFQKKIRFIFRTGDEVLLSQKEGSW
jgi:hypothetical protein